MKSNILKLILAFFAISTLFLSCSKDEDDSEVISGEGNITFKFENGFGNLGDIVLNSTTQTSSNNQKHQFSTLKYIISNVVLIKEDGTEVKYHYNDPDKGAFIIDQSEAVGGICSINLQALPAGDYKKVRFGLGISNDSYILGQSGQATFWSAAQSKGMTWSWAAGYINIKLEGKYGVTTLDGVITHHVGKKMSIATNPEIYREITVTMPSIAKIRTNITPSVHFMVDFNKYLSGTTPILIDASNQTNMSGTGVAVTIADNLTQSFMIEHVHND